MRFMCYSDKVADIRIELRGRQVALSKWQFIRDSSKKIFESLPWVKNTSTPKGRAIVINCKKLPTKDEWRDVTSRWLTVLEANSCSPEKFVDNDVIYSVDLPEDDCDCAPAIEMPKVVTDKLQKAFWEECKAVLEHKDAVEVLKRRVKKGKEGLSAARARLREMAKYLDSQGLEIDDEHVELDAVGDAWVEVAVDCGALEDD